MYDTYKSSEFYCYGPEEHLSEKESSRKETVYYQNKDFEMNPHVLKKKDSPDKKFNARFSS